MDKARLAWDEVGIAEPQHWKRTGSARLLRGLASLGALILIVWVARALSAVLNEGVDFFGWNLDKACKDYGLSCGALTGFLLPVMSLALATALFLIGRMWLVLRPRRKLSRSAPHELVPTAGAIAGQVVGRDELCKVVIDNLRFPEGRRPQLVVGGVGTGKTAVIVQLMRLLAEYKATPVAVDLRDVGTDFRFSDVARKQFTRQIHSRVRTGADEDRIWRYLREEGRIVVLADGLEEALSQDANRDYHIRLAIEHAKAEDLPLVITSRPHDSLRGMDVSISELEPLSKEAALQYLQDGDSQRDPRRLNWIVETAGVAEAPLYLRIVHELNHHRLLSHLVTDDDEPGGWIDTRDLDRSALRRRLLDTWRLALVRGQLQGHVPLSPAQRQATIAFVAALACVGLQEDRLEVEYTRVLEHDDDAEGLLWDGGRAASPDQGERLPEAMAWMSDRFRNEHLGQWVASQMPALPYLWGVVDARLAAIWAAQLGLVELRGNALRFEHSVLQAYLGSLALEGVSARREARAEFLDDAFRGPYRPGRELLIALVLFSRRLAAKRLPGGATDLAMTDQTAQSADIVTMLWHKAEGRFDPRGLDMLAAALEIDAVVAFDRRRQHELAAYAASRWLAFRASDPRTLEEAKLGFVHRFGEALREVDLRMREAFPARRVDDPGLLLNQQAHLDAAYLALFNIGCHESMSYLVRHAVAQELGLGGVTAYRALESTFSGAWNALDDGEWQHNEQVWRQIVTCACLAPQLLDGRNPAAPPRTWGVTPIENLSGWISRVGRPEVRGRWSPPEGDAGGAAVAVAEPVDTEMSALTHDVPESQGNELTVWPRVFHTGRWQVPVPQLPISVEVALAQGFKHAANRRARHPRGQAEWRTLLAEQALELLKRTGFWFSQLTLLQALGLWALPDDPVDEERRIPGSSSAGVYGADIRAQVHHWVEVAGSLRDEGRESRHEGSTPQLHPLVREMGELVIKALKTGRPERFMWIDEHRVTSKIGASAINRAELRSDDLWIPSWIGWSALDGRAQVLVAEVQLLMNLTDRGETAQHRETRLSRANRRDLPPCLTRDRRTLDPNREIGVPGDSQPGMNCTGGCEFGLCPYPPKGRVGYQAEFSEAFCRRQQTLLDWSHRRRPWQEVLPRELNSFWGEMATRARR